MKKPEAAPVFHLRNLDLLDCLRLNTLLGRGSNCIAVVYQGTSRTIPYTKLDYIPSEFLEVENV